MPECWRDGCGLKAWMGFPVMDFAAQYRAVLLCWALISIDIIALTKMLLLKTEHFWSDKSFRFNAYRLPWSKYFSIIGVKPDEDGENFTLCQSGISGLQNQTPRCSPNTILVWDLVWGFQEMFWSLLFFREQYKDLRNLREILKSPAHVKFCTLWSWGFEGLQSLCSGFPELAPVLMWNCWFRDPKPGVLSLEGKEGSTSGLQLCALGGSTPQCSHWCCWHNLQVLDLLFQTQDSFCAGQMHLLRRHTAGWVPPERIPAPRGWFQ